MASVEQVPTTITTTEEAAAAEQAGGTTTPPTSSGPVLALLMYHTPSAPPGQPPNAPQRPHDRATSKVIGKRKLLVSPPPNTGHGTDGATNDNTQRAVEAGELNDFRLDAETGGAAEKLTNAEIKAAKLGSE